MSPIDDWIIAALTPLPLLPNRTPAALIRAGALALLDCTTCIPATAARDQAALLGLLAALPVDGPALLGLRMRARQCAAQSALLAALEGRAHWLVLSDWDADPSCIPTAVAGRELWLEVTAGEQLERLPAGLTIAGRPIAGLIGVGTECGGETGREGAFVLAQHLAGQKRPFLMRGAIDIGAAAACRVAGAAGVICDDTLLLLAESPLAPRLAQRLAGLTGSDTRLLGEHLGRAVRILMRPDFPASGELDAVAEPAPGAGEPCADAWDQALSMRLGWTDAARQALPIGEGLGAAARVAQRFRTVGRYVTALRTRSAALVAAAARDAALAPEAALAKALGTRLPIVQGPMTRVSDRAELALAVAKGGALPLIAAGQQTPEELRVLLAETARRLAGQPWGVGLLGFVASELREAQFALVEELRPPWVLISGGIPQQAIHLETQGIPTWLHCPESLIAQYCAEGVRRFVFEGAECGGHVGPLHAFALWQGAVERLLGSLTTADLGRLQVLFAGGIHDARSAAMVAALAAPLTAAGASIGVLMGTAYLFTPEALAAGAIVPAFQELAQRSAGTRVIETGPGHRIRCAPNAFTDRFERERRQRLASGETGRSLSEALERLTRGRARIAAKGLERQADSLVALAAVEQQQQGMYMLGELAALRRTTIGIAALHQAVCEDSVEWLRQVATESTALGDAHRARPVDVAIIGVSCWLPGAVDKDAYWQLLLQRTSAIREIPPQRWDWRLYYGSEARASDQISAKWGGFMDALPFDPLRFGIPPKSLTAITPPQLAALELTRRALVDAGFGEQIEDSALRARTSVVIGIANTADLEQGYVTRSTLPLVAAGSDPSVLERLPQWNEESFPGMLRNVVAGRVANRFDLGGTNLAVDAACASSLAALDLAVHDLAEGRSDLALSGAIDLEMSPHAFLGFSHSQALSPRGLAEVFDAQADGIVISEGAVMLVLKRLADAERDGDRVYAVIRAVAGSSDGRGLSLTAPDTAGQRLAIERAWSAADLAPGVDPGIGLYEAHGTGTTLGDGTELNTIDGALRRREAAPASCVLGSVKGLIGHTRSAAGLAGLLKAALALHYRVLPPHSPVRTPLAPLRAADSPLCLLDRAYPWPTPGIAPRRAAVSAFGFGGSNYHALLEEWRPAVADLALPDARPWPSEVFLIAATGPAELIQRLDLLAAAAERLATAESVGELPLPWRLRDLAYSCALAWATPDADAPRQVWRAALIVVSTDELLQLHRQARAALDNMDCRSDSAAADPGEDLVLAEGAICIGRGPAPGALAFVFPGQGAQHPGMGAELALYCPEISAAIEAAEQLLVGPRPALRSILWPPATHDDEGLASQRQALADTRVAQPAIAALGCGLLDLAVRLGLQPAASAGHSFGEFLALHCAGVLGREDLLRLAVARGATMGEEGATGSMAAVAATASEVAQALVDHPEVVVANRNAPRQTVIAGPPEALGEVAQRLQAQGRAVQPLPVSGAFHSPAMAVPAALFANHLAAVDLAASRIPVYANLDGRPYPADPEQARMRLHGHMLAGVDFVAQIEQMYAAGVRTFVELGTAAVLTGLIERILATDPNPDPDSAPNPNQNQGRVHLAMAADGGLRGWLRLIARLYARGHAMTPQALFAGRDCRCIDLESKFPAAPADPGWRLDAGRIRPVVASAAARLGRAPLLDLDSAAATPVVDINHCDIQGLSPGERVAYAAYLDYERSMQRFLEQQELAVGQLLALCTEAQSRAETQPERPAEPAAPPARSVDLPRTPVNPPLTAAAVSDCLVAIISDHTGYPADAIGLEMDLEGDLGIDSIKRVEIAVALQERLPAAVAAGLKGRLETLTTRRTVAAMASACEPYLQLGPPLEESPPETPPETPLAEDSLAALAQSTAPPQPCPRSLPQCVPVMLPIRRRERLSGLFLVTEDALGIAAPLLGLLRARGAAAYPLSIADLDSDRALDRRHGVLRQRHGPVRGVLHLAALGRDQADTLSDWRRCTELACKRLLRLLQLSVGDFERAAEPPLVIAASGLGGNFGRGSDNLGAVAAGGQHGLLRTLVREYPAVQARSVDLDQALAPTAAAALLLEEVLADDGEPEVGYPGGRRQAIRYVAAPLAAPVAGATGATDWEPQPGWIILATGGARGITAATLAGLPLDGVRLILVGRGPAPMVGEPTDAEAIEALRQGLSAELRSGAGRAAEELQAEIARSDVELRRCRRDLACHSALERLRRAGADLEYHAVDCRDEAAFGGLIEDIYRRFGRIDAVLHGAGVIEDQRLARKSAQSFSRVFDTKADGLYLLAKYLRPEGLRWLVCFSSVSGRYGNPGQADYAAANEVLNRACWVLRQRWPSTRIAAINWGPWATLGMADDAVLQLLAGRGIESITPAQGCAFFATELGVGDPTEVEVIAGQGPWTEGLDIDQGLAQLIAQIGMAMRTPAPC